jgi:hypothetical protein
MVHKVVVQAKQGDKTEGGVQGDASYGREITMTK